MLNDESMKLEEGVMIRERVASAFLKVLVAAGDGGVASVKQ